ncbi:Na+/H+ antiporter NhaA [Aliikangiella coralliicola]|uniref:Na(+)/H(+) antiporter NhaA n=1 Tax=Aliikangiella coralliicola TaxID=2592383 RepID=A0A545U4C8_9GAMM|nr:Na+/H+ antiporter NhaA [Aliikangiella coralliicola]TQV84329.1 Na+/H+ antiporter NhaA [Aliikangiella coralliicola]
MVDSVKYLFRSEAAGGILLVTASVLALMIANSSIQHWYDSLLEMPVVFKIGLFEINKPMLLWVNDGLMALFFFLVGLEIKREAVSGHLSNIRQLTLPLVAAIAGIAVPALIFLWFNGDDPIASNGWAIPSATDIAFALGIFVIFGKHLPLTLKLFLLSVAIFDDIAAVIIIALFYSQDLSVVSIAVAVTGLVGLAGLNYFNVQKKAAYILLGLIVWAAVLKSGVHATLAGFAIAWFIPLKREQSQQPSMLEDIEHSLHPWVTFFILPFFAFANAGVNLLNATIETLTNSVTLGIAFGLFVGKQFGIFLACWLAIKLRLAKLPENTSWIQLYAVSLLCGVGFTMSLFIGTLAYEQEGLIFLESVKVGVLIGSVLSALFGAIIISRIKVKKSLQNESTAHANVPAQNA